MAEETAAASVATPHSRLPRHCGVCGKDWPGKYQGLCPACRAGLPCRADTTDTVAPDPPCAGRGLGSARKGRPMSEREQEALFAARRLVDANECKMHGHDWDLIVVFGSPYPQSIFCRRNCGAPVLKVEQPKTSGPTAAEVEVAREPSAHRHAQGVSDV